MIFIKCKDEKIELIIKKSIVKELKELCKEKHLSYKKELYQCFDNPQQMYQAAFGCRLFPVSEGHYHIDDYSITCQDNRTILIEDKKYSTFYRIDLEDGMNKKCCPTFIYELFSIIKLFRWDIFKK